jgi:hypothetical protein
MARAVARRNFEGKKGLHDSLVERAKIRNIVAISGEGDIQPTGRQAVIRHPIVTPASGRKFLNRNGNLADRWGHDWTPIEVFDYRIIADSTVIAIG